MPSWSLVVGSQSVRMPLRLLLIDDDEIDRVATRRALLAAGLEFELLEAADATSGLERATATAQD